MGISPIGSSCLCLLLLLNVAHGVHESGKDSKIVPPQALDYHGNGRASLLRGSSEPTPAVSFLTIEGRLNENFMSSVRGLLVRLEYLDFQDQRMTGRPSVARPQFVPTYVFRPLPNNANPVVGIEMTATTAGDGTTGSDSTTDTSAILDSYRDLEERVASLEDGGVTRRVEAGDAIAAAKAQAEALIRAALQDVANGAQAQAAAQAAEALQQAAQDQANQQTSTAPNAGGGGDNTPPPAGTATDGNNNPPAGSAGGGGSNTVNPGGDGGGSNTPAPSPSAGSDNGNPGATGPGCCTDAINQINDLRAEIDQLKNVAASLQNGGGGNVITSTADNTPPPPVASSAPAVITPEASSAPVVVPPEASTVSTVIPPPSTTGGGSSIIDATAECNSDIDATKAVVDPKVVEEEAAQHAAETEALLKKLPLSDKLNISPKLLRDSNQLVTDLNAKHQDVSDQLASQCAEPTCPVPGGGAVEADTTS